MKSNGVNFDFLLTFPCLTEPFLKVYVKNILYRFLSFSHAATFQVLHFSSLSLLSGIQGSSICRLTVLWSWITGISTDRCAWTGPRSIGACGCRAGVVRHIMDRIWNGLSAALDSRAQHSLWMKTGKVSLPRRHCNHPKPTVYCMERISFTFMLSASEQPSSWMVKISEQFYDGFLGIAARRWIQRALSHDWCNQRAAKACYCTWMD